MSNETKVGMVVIVGLAVLMGIVSFLGMFTFSADTYDLFIRFKRTTGLKPGDIVHYVGVPVGQVSKIEVAGNSVRVAVNIKDEIKIPENSLYILGSEGVMGAMYIDIEPPPAIGDKYVKPGSEVIGMTGSSMNDFMTSASGVLQKLELMADSVNNIFSDKDVQESLRTTLVNVGHISTNFNDLSKVLADVAVKNQNEFNQMIHQLSSMSVHMNQMAGRLDVMLKDIDNEGQTSKELVTTLHNLQKASENVAKITQSIEGLTSDPQTTEDIKATLKNAREASAKANRMLGGVGSSQGSIDIKYGDKPDKYRFDASLKFGEPKKFILMGVSDIGEDNDVNLQMGMGSDRAALRAGLVLGDVGAGVDVAPLKWLRLSADAYDPNDVKIRVGGEVKFSDKLSFVAESLDVRKKASDSAYFGLRGYF